MCVESNRTRIIAGERRGKRVKEFAAAARATTTTTTSICNFSSSADYLLLMAVTD